MAEDGTSWRKSLAATERYENILAIQKALSASGSDASALALEDNAYQTSSSREEYDAACQRLVSAEDAGDAPSAVHTSDDEGSNGSTTRIGPYPSCHYIASGVTAEVYRHGDRALKVIVETRDIEPHNPYREAKILGLLKRPCIPLLETFRDQEQRFVLVFPYMPLTLLHVLEQGPVSEGRVKLYFKSLFQALEHIHGQGIIHRDIKPSALLLESPDGPAYLSDFGTAWHPEFSATSERRDAKVLDIGTGPYRSPEALFGDKAYGVGVDMWGAGVMLAECAQDPPKPPFESRAVHEDGNQLGLILSIFKTIGTPTPESWPEAATFRTPPFEMYQVFKGKPWMELLPGVNPGIIELVAGLIKYDTRTRLSAKEALEFPYLKD